MTRLQPLTNREIDRMRNLYAMYPLTPTETDRALSQKGWVRFVEGSAEPSKAAYRRDNGDPCLYDDRGWVADCWRLEAKP